MTDTDNKPCIACGLPINASAMRCQHCHAWQAKWILAAYKPAYPIIFVLFFIVLFGSMFYEIYSGIALRNISFSDYKDSITVVDSKFNFTEEEHGNRITSLGHLRNNSDVPWKSLCFEVQYFNKSGELIDTVADKNYDLVIQPNAEVTFRIRGVAARASTEYSQHKVLINWAENAR